MSVPQAQRGADAGWYAGFAICFQGLIRRKIAVILVLKLADTLLANHSQIRRAMGLNDLPEWLRSIFLFCCLFDTHHAFISGFFSGDFPH